MGTARRAMVGVAAAAVVVIAVAGTGWAQSTTSSSTSTTTSTSTSTTTSTTLDRCLDDLIQVDLDGGAVECRRPDGSLACLMPAAFFGTCPPRLPEGPITTLPPDDSRVAVTTGQDPAPTRSTVRFTG